MERGIQIKLVTNWEKGKCRWSWGHNKFYQQKISHELAILQRKKSEEEYSFLESVVEADILEQGRCFLFNHSHKNNWLADIHVSKWQKMRKSGRNFAKGGQVTQEKPY